MYLIKYYVDRHQPHDQDNIKKGNKSLHGALKLVVMHLGVAHPEQKADGKRVEQRGYYVINLAMFNFHKMTPPLNFERSEPHKNRVDIGRVKRR